MIGLALKLLRDQLSSYLHENTVPQLDKNKIIIGNIAQMESDDADYLKDKIIISLVNTEEESTLKNSSNTLRTSSGIKYIEPPVFLNLYILITSVHGQQSAASPDAYEIALHRLSLVIQFFQAKKTFSIKNSPFTTIANANNIPQETKDQIRLNVELYTLTFEQINHLWGSLGGKQMPFAMYKIRLVKIQENNGQMAPVIETIKTVETIVNAESNE